MILDDIADGAGFIVEGTAALDSEILGHGYLEAFNIVAIPESLHEGVGETEDNHVVYRTLVEVMVDAENCGLIELAEKDFVEMLGRCQVMAERFLDDDAGIGGADEVLYVFNHRLEHDWRDCE